ncbi:hypothetical protein [uncultured Roseovarius sp.]|uniref:hypothetical protein n=1 Tax=uncultured Roseovarius sp. TaxID=293344 RepID=UPI00260ADF22|nr:hypothetical protein [uncultured Roseovarius sp.]
MKTHFFEDAFSTLFSALLIAVSAACAHAEPGVVEPDDLVPLGGLSLTAPDFELPALSPELPLLDLEDNSPEAGLLRQFQREGRAAGFKNVIYDNRDRGHSKPKPGQFPTLSQLVISDELKKRNLDYGLAGGLIVPAIVIGNSSTALTKGKYKRSQPRLAMTTPEGPTRAFLTYITNHLYIYPEHRDHDKVDLFPANWPYMVITQGSSHSDRPFMRALFMAVAALSPDTQQALQEKNLVAPTLQMILRRSQKAIYSREAYLSGRAHPTVFSKKDLVPERMVTLASSLKPEEIPPMIVLTVEEEDFGSEAGLASLSEKLFDTPSAIARVWRGFEFSKRMMVSAGKTADPNGHTLKFSWVLLRGDPNRVRIAPIGESGAKAEITVEWHDTRQIMPSQKRLTHRVDIGVFAWNGFHDSAPALISISFPGHQKREYKLIQEIGPMRLSSVDYRAAERNAAYDPWIYWTAPWKDLMEYDGAAILSGIKREMSETVVELSGPNMLPNGKAVQYTLKDTENHRLLSMEFETAQ